LSFEDAPQRMLDVLSRPGWHGYVEIAAACDIDADEALVDAIYRRLLAEGYTRAAIQRENGPDGSRYRWEPHSRPPL
jgi:hypothetical protein